MWKDQSVTSAQYPRLKRLTLLLVEKEKKDGMCENWQRPQCLINIRIINHLKTDTNVVAVGNKSSKSSLSSYGGSPGPR